MDTSTLKLMTHAPLESSLLNSALALIQQDSVSTNFSHWKIHGENHDDRYVVNIKSFDGITYDERASMTLAFVKPSWEHAELPVVDNERRVVGLVTLDAVLRALREETIVVLMAGGLGSRLRPLTESTPKPLLPVGGRPLLEITVDNLARQGFLRFVLSVNYKAEMFREHFGSGEKFGVDIQYVHEAEQLGTAGALRLLPERPAAPLLVMNGDILTNFNARHLVQFHREQQVVATMCVREYEWKVPYGVVSMSDNGRMQRFEEKPSRREFVNAGIYVLSPDVLDHLPGTGPIDMPTLIDRASAAAGAAAVYPLHEYWLDIGHLDDLQRAQDDFPGLFG